MNNSSARSPISLLAVSIIYFLNSESYLDSHSTLGKRLAISLKKINLSSVTIFGILKSLKALINNGSSGIYGSALFN